MATRDTRPYYLNLIKIHLPIPGVVSILHRISGILMFLSIPVVTWLFELSSRDADGFARATDFLAQPLVKLATLLMIWSLLHHLFAGIRFLLTDFDIGLERAASRRNAWLVIAAEVLVMAFIMVRMCL